MAGLCEVIARMSLIIEMTTDKEEIMMISEEHQAYGKICNETLIVLHSFKCITLNT